MRSRRGVLAAIATVSVLALAACGDSGAKSTIGDGGTLRVSGSTTVNPVAADAAEVLRKGGLKVTVDASGGSAGGIAQLGDGQVEIAMSSKPISDSDRQKYPGTDFVPTEIGQDAVGVIVRREVFDGGLRSLTREQTRLLFEGQVKNWKELGGPDLMVFVYDKEPGRGTREVLDKYLYGKEKPPPPPQSDAYAIVGGNQEARTKLLSTPGSVGPLSSSFIEGYDQLVAFAIEGVEPTPGNVASSSYPMARPLFLITDGPPTGAARRFIDYVLSAPGQELVRKHGYLTLANLGSA